MYYALAKVAKEQFGLDEVAKEFMNLETKKQTTERFMHH